MVALNEALYKHLAADGAVTTNNKAGILYYAIFFGGTVGDKCVIKDGATTIFTLVTEAVWKPVIVDLRSDGERPTFNTDIDVDVTLAATGFATFIYKEIGA